MHACKKLLCNCSSVFLHNCCIVPVCLHNQCTHFPCCSNLLYAWAFDRAALCVGWRLQRVKGLFIQLSVHHHLSFPNSDLFTQELETRKYKDCYDGHLGYNCQHCFLFYPSNTLTSIFSCLSCPILCFYCANPPFSSVSCTFSLPWFHILFLLGCGGCIQDQWFWKASVPGGSTVESW